MLFYQLNTPIKYFKFVNIVKYLIGNLWQIVYVIMNEKNYNLT